MEQQFLTVKQAAARAQVDPNTIRRWQTAGKLGKYKIEGRVLVNADELNAKIAPVGSAAGS